MLEIAVILHFMTGIHTVKISTDKLQYHYTEILQGFFDEFWRKAEIFIELQTWGLYCPISIGVSSKVCKCVGTETVSRQLLFQ